LGYLSLDPGPGQSGYQANYDYGYGDPNASGDKGAIYLFPYEHGVKHGVVQGYFGKITHQTCDCLDFDLAENSPICAARDGMVVLVKQDSDVGGPSPEFRNAGNCVWILHDDGTWAQYGHLRKNGARVHPGQRVRAGQVIAFSGHTGQAHGPHLHFEVDQANWDKTPSTLPTKFLVQGGQVVDPVEGKYYYSFHPGGPAFKEIKAETMTEETLERYTAPAPAQGAVTVRSVRLDGKTYFYGSNGTNQDRTLTVQFPNLKNLTCSKPLPYTKTIPAGKEVYLLSLDWIDVESPFSFSFGYSYR
jgi:murein DD-endopeptidase MepM/ murein hydrolase activator NlpD